MIVMQLVHRKPAAYWCFFACLISDLILFCLKKLFAATFYVMRKLLSRVD